MTVRLEIMRIEEDLTLLDCENRIHPSNKLVDRYTRLFRLQLGPKRRAKNQTSECGMDRSCMLNRNDLSSSIVVIVRQLDVIPEGFG